MFENRLHLLSVAASVLLFDEGFVRLQDGKQLVVSGVVDEDALSVRAGDGKALLSIASLPVSIVGTVSALNRSLGR